MEDGASAPSMSMSNISELLLVGVSCVDECTRHSLGLLLSILMMRLDTDQWLRLAAPTSLLISFYLYAK